MFSKQFCEKCRKKTSKKNFFCPSCGNKLKGNNEDWGMLGKNDSINEMMPFHPLLNGFSGKIINKMFGSAMRMLEREMQKEMQKENKNTEKSSRTNFKLMINGKEVKFSNLKQIQKNSEKLAPRMDFEDEQVKYFTKLPKKEPKTSLRRIGDKIVYELKIPGVKSPKDVIVNKLENSIEVKAIGKTKAYFKVIPINMPVINQVLSDGKLVLELREN